MPAGTVWTISSGSTTTTTTGSSAKLTASMSPGSATVSAKIDNTSTQVTFSVIAPSSFTVGSHTDAPLGTYDSDGTEIGAAVSCDDRFMPDSVSFANVSFRENPSSISVTVPWPSTNGPKTMSLRSSFNTDCDNSFSDYISSGLDLASYLSSGTGYAGCSFSASWEDDYLNASGVWTFISNLTATFTYSSDKSCQVTYCGSSGSSQGPYSP
jgi:hypothetical protein